MNAMGRSSVNAGEKMSVRAKPSMSRPTGRPRKYRMVGARSTFAVGTLFAQQTKEATTEAPAKDEVITLPAFSISSEKDTGFVGKSALSSTRIAVDLSEIPQSVKVLNQSFLKAVNPFMLTDILNYTGGAQNGQLNWTPGRLNIRGFTGDGDYNDSFSPPAGSTSSRQW